MLGPSQDAHLVMGIFISGNKTGGSFQNSLFVSIAMMLPLTNITFPGGMFILPSHKSSYVVTHTTELFLLNSAAAVNIHKLLEEKQY